MSTTLLFSLSLFIGSLLFLFFYWRKLREDYELSSVFSSGLAIILSSIFGSLLAHLLLSPNLPQSPVFNPSQIWFWGAVLGFFLALSFSTVRFKLRFFETFDATVIGINCLLLTFFLANFILEAIWQNLFLVLLSLVLLVVYFILDSKYKKLSWYRSGKVGFSGLVTMGIYFLARSLIAINFADMLSLSGKIEIIVSAVVAFLLFFAVYNLAEQE
jgi:hypothetical protein